MFVFNIKIYKRMITGNEFNEQNKGVRFVKLTNESCCHNGFKFKEGLNVDTIEFNEKEKCGPGGLYFCGYEDFIKWTHYGDHERMEYMWDVTIPDEEKVIFMKNKLKVHSFILSNKQYIWDNDKLCLESVKYNGNALRHVKDQTEEICSEAVKQYGYALRYVKKQTEEICLEAVKQNGYALRFVKEHTEELCLEAVKQNGGALRYVKKQTEEICLEAVKQNERALEYVKEEFKEVCQEYLDSIKTNSVGLF